MAVKRKPLNIAFKGDSLTEWYDWQGRFSYHYVMNLGIAGELVDGLLKRMGRIVAIINKPDFIFIMTGINNIAAGDFDITETYQQIMKRLSESYKNFRKIIKVQNKHLREVADNSLAEYFDVYNLFVDSSGEPITEYLLDDGVHISHEGYEVWADVVEDFLSSKSSE